MKTMETTHISSILTVSQNNEKFCIEDVIGKEHIEDTSSGLTIYVPRKKKDQDVCFSSALPKKFAEWIMLDPITQIPGTVDSEMINILGSVFRCHRSALREICEHEGVIQIEVPNEDFEDDVEEEDDSDLEEDRGQIQKQLQGQERRKEQSPQVNSLALSEGTSSEQQSTSSHSSTNTSLSQTSETPNLAVQGSNLETLVETVSRRSHFSYHSPPVSQRQEDIPSHRHRPIVDSGHSSSPDSPLTSVESRENLASSGPSDDTQYGVLLERVVAAAQSATFPSQGSFDMSDLRNNLPGQLWEDTFESFDGLDISTRFRSANQLERDKKVGAAGELFVSIASSAT